MGNIETKKIKPYFDPKKNISFGGKSEAEMIEKYNFSDIIWYAPEKSEKLEKWKAFSNVEVYKATNEDELLECMMLNGNLITLIIMTGKYAEEIFKKPNQLGISNRDMIIIYCLNSEYHKKWSKNYKEIIAVTTTPNEIFNSLLYFQKNQFNSLYSFNYKILGIKKYNFNYFLEGKTNKLIFDNFSLKLNRYEKYCFYLQMNFKAALSYKKNKNFEEFFYDFRCCFSKIINLFYGETIDDFPYSAYQQFFLLTNLQENVDKPPQELLLFLIKLSFISVFFSKFPYLYGLLSYKEIEKKLCEKITIDNLRKSYRNMFHHLDLLHKNLAIDKTMNLTTQDQLSLKQLHYFLIDFIKYKTKFDMYSRFPILIKYLMDIDFCLKYFFEIIFQLVEYEKYGIYESLYDGVLLYIDKRIDIFNEYIHTNIIENEVLKIISKEDLIKLNNSIKINDFIVLGNKEFHKFIKKIEKNIAHQNINYLKISELRNYLKKEIENTEKERIFRYFLLIEIEEMQRIYKDIYSIIKEFSLILHIIIYSKDDKIFVNKIPFQIPYFPIFLANSTEELINYIKSQEYLNCGFNLITDMNEDLNSRSEIINEFNDCFFPNEVNNEIKEDEIDELVIEDGWELLDKVPKKALEKILLERNWTDSVGEMKRNMFKMLKENNNGGNANEKYKCAKYFSFKLYPESLPYFIDIIVKQFCYAYTTNNFYYFLNKELRSGDSKKINKYIELISIINTALEEKAIKSYKGELYRGTFIQNDILDNILIEGKTIINLAFMSTSKSRKQAEKFLTPKKNVLFIIETNENNIDIDSEYISRFQNEREVLFIPYSKFLVIKKQKIIFKFKDGNNKEIYEIKLKGIDDSHERKKIKKFSLSGEQIKIMYEKGFEELEKMQEPKDS